MTARTQGGSVLVAAVVVLGLCPGLPLSTPLMADLGISLTWRQVAQAGAETTIAAISEV